MQGVLLPTIAQRMTFVSFSEPFRKYVVRDGLCMSLTMTYFLAETKHRYSRLYGEHTKRETVAENPASTDASDTATEGVDADGGKM